MRILKALGIALLASLGSLSSVTATADTYPSKPVRIVIPYAPGGGADALARQLGLALGKELGQPFIIDSKPGANTAIAASFVVQGAGRWLHAAAHRQRHHVAEPAADGAHALRP
jgi:tripartite-type tricarboxylate transporter receptor subunit TctC